MSAMCVAIVLCLDKKKDPNVAHAPPRFKSGIEMSFLRTDPCGIAFALLSAVHL